LKLGYADEGAQLFSGVALDCLNKLEHAFAGVRQGNAGTRLENLSELADFVTSVGSIGNVAASVLGANAKPVRAIAFDKSAKANWSLDWHQDRVICVKDRRQAPGFGPWTIKSGKHHVAPPFELLVRMATLRVHLDAVGPDNAPLLIAPGSHRLGQIAEGEIRNAVARCGTHTCLAKAGDIWLYSTPILHRSKRSKRQTRRRVLQLDYAAFELPFGLKWLDLV
jgi:hypothetical protein